MSVILLEPDSQRYDDMKVNSAQSLLYTRDVSTEALDEVLAR